MTPKFNMFIMLGVGTKVAVDSLFSNPLDILFFVAAALVQEANEDGLREVNVLRHLNTYIQEY